MKILFFLCILFVPAQKTLAQNTTTQNKIDSLLTNHYELGNFNGTALVVKDGNTIYERSFGYANGTDKAPLKTSDKFGIGSIVKELPAIAVMQLQEKGLLDIDDHISKYVPGLPEWSQTVTIKNLFQYTSGLPQINWGKHKVISNAALFNDILEIKELQFKPNEGYLYSNNNPFLLSQIVQNISGKDFSDYIRENILVPFGLHQSVFKTKFPYKNRSDVAIPFNDEFKEDAIPFEISLPLFLFTTSAYDLYKLNHELHTYKIISESSLKTIAEISSLDFDNKQSPLGTVEIIDNKIINHAHHGSSGNYECLIRKDVIADLTIVLFTNRKKSNLHTISDKISKIVL